MANGRQCLVGTSSAARAAWAWPVGPRSAADRPSQPAPLSVLSEVTRQLLGLCAPAQVGDVLLLEDRLAIDGILESFELRLEMLDARRKCLQPLLPVHVR